MKHLLPALVLWCAASVAQATGFGLPPAPRLGQPASTPDTFVAPDTEPPHSQRSPKQAAREAQQINSGGRVLSVDAANGGWRVKLLKDGNVRIVFVPD